MNFFDKLLEDLKLIFNKFFVNKFGLILLFFMILTFFIVSYYCYEIMVKNKLTDHKLNKEFTNRDKNDNMTIMYFYTEWCPYCKSSKPEWDEFKSYMKNIEKTVDYNIDLISIDCDKQKDIADKYAIEGYPSIKLIYKGNEYEFDAKVTKANLIQFYNSTDK